MRWSWLATSLGVGRIRWGPGTFGSAVGLLLGLAALRWLRPALSLGLLVPLWWLAALICTRAEQELRVHDPAVVVLDEVCGMATVVVCLPWTHPTALRSPGSVWLLMIAGFVLFRFFDIFKPPPLPLLARLPAGWGIVMDDLGAALYTIGVLVCARSLL